jgi:hypothetical protein
MRNMSTKQAVTKPKTDGQIIVTTPYIEPAKPGKDILKTLKHTAQVAASDAAIIGDDIKAASKEMIKDGKNACACTEKAVLTATEKALKTASRATSKSARAVHKKVEAK